MSVRLGRNTTHFPRVSFLRTRHPASRFTQSLQCQCTTTAFNAAFAMAYAPAAFNSPVPSSTASTPFPFAARNSAFPVSNSFRRRSASTNSST